jgi:hypothetical protein
MLSLLAFLALLALGTAVWVAVAISMVTGVVLDLGTTELLVPLWCWLSRDEATMARLDAIVAARREVGGTAAYDPRHARLEQSPEEAEADRYALVWIASHRFGCWF